MNFDDNYAGRESFESTHRYHGTVWFGDDLVCKMDYKKSVTKIK